MSSSGVSASDSATAATRAEFCAASIRISPHFKTKPVDRVIAELRRIKEVWRRPFIEFADDNTFASMRHGDQTYLKAKVSF